MHPVYIFFPVIALVLLTFIVWIRMYQTRVAEMRAKRIHPQKIATSGNIDQLLTDSARARDNYNNLFELPVLFYTIAVILFVTNSADNIQLILASGFVIGRYVHTIINITYNKVMHRFRAFAISSMFLWAMWLLFAIDVFREVF